MFRKIREYFTKKTVKQRVFIIIALVLVAVFTFFFIKGNFFDSAKKTAGNSGEDGEQVYSVKFHISLIDIGVLAVIIVLFVIHKFRERKRHRR